MKTSLSLRPYPWIILWILSVTVFSVGHIPAYAQIDYNLYGLNITGNDSIHSLGIQVTDIEDNDRIDYVIVTADSLKPSLMELVEWRRCLGMRAKIVSVEEIGSTIEGEIDLPLKIKTYLYDLYRNHALEYVTLAGTVNQVPTRYCDMLAYGHFASIPADVYYTAFDNEFSWNANGNNIYGETDDNIDLIADISISRIPCESPQEIRNIVNKIIQYERSFDKYEGNPEIIYFGSKINKLWGVKSNSHVMAEQIKALYYNTAPVKSDMLFDTGSSIQGLSYDLTSIQSALSSGYMWAFEISHGNYTYWYNSMPDENDNWNYYCLNASQLENNHSLIISTLACNTAAYDQPICLGASFLKNNQGGCVNYIGSCRLGWISSTPTESPSYAQFVMGNMLKDFLISDISLHKIGDIFNTMKTIYGPAHTPQYPAYRWLYYSHSLLGDVATRCFNKTPLNINAVYDWADDNQIRLRITNLNQIDNPSLVITDNPVLDSYSHRIITAGQEILVNPSSNNFTLCVQGDNVVPLVKSVEIIKDVIVSDVMATTADIVMLKNVNINDFGKLEVTSSSIRIAPSVKSSRCGTFKITAK